MTRSIPKLAVETVVLAAVLLAAVCASPARADYGVERFAFSSTSTQAGAHPDVSVDIDFNRTPIPDDPGKLTNDGITRDLAFDIPAGISGNAENITPCAQRSFNSGTCPVASQVGTLGVALQTENTPSFTSGVWVIEPRNGSETVRLGARFLGAAVVNIVFSARSDGDLGLHAVAYGLAPYDESAPVGVRLKLWGVPADPSHDAERRISLSARPGPLPIPRVAFVSNPTKCGPQAPATMVAHSFEHPDVDARATAAATPDIVGCDRVRFDPAFTFRALTPQADSPSGFDATLTVPPQPAVAPVDTSHLRTLDVTLPEGVALAPPAAATLGTCADDDLRLGLPSAATCPDTARIADAQIDVPVLRAPLTGGVYVRPPTPGHLFRLAIVASGVGVDLKLVGEAIPDPTTGRLRAVFDEAPQQPVSAVRLRFKGGPDAPLATPQRCTSTGSTTGTATGWSGAVRAVSDPFAITSGPGGTACPDPAAFDPGVTAGSTGLAGGTGSIDLRLTRPDGQPDLGALSVTLAKGLLGRIDTVTPCPAAAAEANACPAASRIGAATVGAGAGASPLYVRGPVYLTDGYRGAPFGLSVVVPTAGQAGPFDLGLVTVRAALFIDPATAQVRIDTDPLPQLLRGVPLRLRDVRVAIDRPGFVVNPTDCSPTSIGAVVTAATPGSTASRPTPYRVGDCAALGYRPKLSLQLIGRRQTRIGRHPGLVARLRPRAGDANTKRVRVTLPKRLALDPANAESLCEPTDAAANRCPSGSIVGRASARSILPSTLRGSVYFVRGERKDSRTGRTIRTLPKLYVPLTGDGVRIDVRADTTVSRGRLVATFGGLPDVPLDGFDLRLDGGRRGILAVSGTDLCRGTQHAGTRLDAHNGRRSTPEIAVGRPCR